MLKLLVLPLILLPFKIAGAVVGLVLGVLGLVLGLLVGVAALVGTLLILPLLPLVLLGLLVFLIARWVRPRPSLRPVA